METPTLEDLQLLDEKILELALPVQQDQETFVTLTAPEGPVGVRVYRRGQNVHLIVPESIELALLRRYRVPVHTPGVVGKAEIGFISRPEVVGWVELTAERTLAIQTALPR